MDDVPMDFVDYDSDESFYSDSSYEPGLVYLNNRRTRSFSEDKEPEPKPKIASTLLDAAAVETAKHYPCHFLEQHEPPLDETLLKRIAFWAFPQDEGQVKTFVRLCMKSEDEWRRGEYIVREEGVHEIRQDGFMVSAIIFKRVTSITTKEDSKVFITFEKQRITSTSCAMCPGVIWCQHIIAVIIHRIRYADQVPLHAPITETLSTLSRDQLQKLLQYAINEDPGGILGRVFQHIDAIRDINSSLNTVQGAPDPTFGVGLDEKSTWELTLNKMKTNLAEEFKHGYRNYPDTCNVMDENRSSFHEQYFQRITELVQKGEIDAAGQVLIGIAQEVLTVLNRGTQSTVRRIFLDMERIWSCFIICFTGPIRKELITTAIDINKNVSKAAADVLTSPNEWSDIASIKLTGAVVGHTKVNQSQGDNAETGVLGAVPTAPFYQPILASLLPDEPKTDRKDEESLPVMLLRFDCLLQWPDHHPDNSQRICNFGITILNKLLKISSKIKVGQTVFQTVFHYQYRSDSEIWTQTSSHEVIDQVQWAQVTVTYTLQLSIMGVKSSKISASTSPVVGSTSKSTKEEEPAKEQKVVGPRSRKRRLPKRYAQSPPLKKAKPEEKKFKCQPVELDDAKIEGCSKAQISCALLYVTFMIIDRKSPDDHLSPSQMSIWMDAVLRAVELGRFRNLLDRSDISYKDYSWLMFLEERLVSHVKINMEENHSYSETAMGYVDALLEHGLQFYGENIPLTLLGILLNTWGLNEEKNLELCVQAVCHTTGPLSMLTIPENSYNNSDNLRIRDHILKKWKPLINSIFQISCKEGATAKPLYITKVLKHLKKVQDGDFVSTAYMVIKDYRKFLVENEHKVMLIGIILECIKRSVNEYSWTSFRTVTGSAWETLIAWGEDLKLQFPKLVLPYWHEVCGFFNSAQLKGLVDVVSESVKDEAILPSELAQMLLSYFEARFRHDEGCVDLLNILGQKDKHRKEALKRVVDNYANYTPRALLLIAKTEHETSNKVKVKDEVFHKRVFDLLKLSFCGIRDLYRDYFTYPPYLDSATFTYLKWFYSVFAQSSSVAVARGEQYATFMKSLSGSFHEDPDSMVSFFETMSPHKVMFDEAKLKLGKALVSCYGKLFDRHLRNSNHSAYHRLLGEMMNARKNCIKYVVKGDQEFNAMIEHIRKFHRGKKKLLKLLDEYFSGSQEEGTV